MATVTNGKAYRFRAYDDNKCLNILTDANLIENLNVTTYERVFQDLAQVWVCENYAATIGGTSVSGMLLKSKKDKRFVLDRFRLSSKLNNADIYTVGTNIADLKDQLVEFILLSNGYYKIKLVYYNLYLTKTSESTYGGNNVKWLEATGDTDQLWAAEEHINYLTYPCKTMRITQLHNGLDSHYPNSTGNPRDYPIDEGGADVHPERSWMYCPCDGMTLERIYGVNGSGVNTIWLRSDEEVVTPTGKFHVVLMVTHPNDDDLSLLREGQFFKRGEAICREGTDGGFAAHFHFSLGKGTRTNNGWIKNSNNAYVLTTSNGTILANNGFYRDPAFTTIDSRSLDLGLNILPS